MIVVRLYMFISDFFVQLGDMFVSLAGSLLMLGRWFHTAAKRRANENAILRMPQ